MLTKKKKERLYGFSVQFSAMAAVFLYILFLILSSFSEEYSAGKQVLTFQY